MSQQELEGIWGRFDLQTSTSDPELGVDAGKQKSESLSSLAGYMTPLIPSRLLSRYYIERSPDASLCYGRGASRRGTIGIIQGNGTFCV